MQQVVAIATPRASNRRGQSLVEFALIALVFYLLLAAVISFGQALFAAQQLQSAADLLARELSRAALPSQTTTEGASGSPVDATLEQILTPVEPTVSPDDPLDPTKPIRAFQQTVFNPTNLRLSISFDRTKLPLVNQMLLPLMIVDPTDRTFLVYPGYDSTLPGGGIVDLTGTRSTDFLISNGGIANVLLNYNYQSGAMASYHQSPDGPFEPNLGNPVIAEVDNPDQPYGPYTGSRQEGRLAAGAKDVRPYTRTISAQAIYRREIFGP
ncbi:MAG: TadE family protein [Schlesneria sp.]|nr:TadE family protein [Schlesneria sp.]